MDPISSSVNEALHAEEWELIDPAGVAVKIGVGDADGARGAHGAKGSGRVESHPAALQLCTAFGLIVPSFCAWITGKLLHCS